MPTTVTLLLKGSLVLFAKEGHPTGSVRILKAPPPNHVLTLSVQRLPPNDDPVEDPVEIFPIEDNLSIVVNNPDDPNITLRDKNAKIDRKAAVLNPDSFRWFVDLENSELYDGPIGVKKSAFKQVLTFNSGELFNDVTADPDNPSYNFLFVQKGSETNYQEFGFVSIRIGIKFTTAHGSIVFTNGNGPDPVFDSAIDKPGTDYIISLTNDTEEHPDVVTDANHYYKALGNAIPPEERILFASITQKDALRAMVKQAKSHGNTRFVAALENVEPPAGPEAACFPAYISRSDP